jgi:hypothetical protein
MGFWLRHLKEGDLLEEMALCERIILKWGIVNMMGSIWTGFIWLRIGSSGRLL